MSSSSLLGWYVYRKATLSPRVDTVELELNRLMQENSARKAGEVKVQMSWSDTLNLFLVKVVIKKHR